MQLTKFPQSCFMAKAKGKKIIIDPGCIGFEDSFLESWKGADAVLLTHKHRDHADPEIIKKISPKETYASQEIANAFPGLKIEVVKEGDSIVLDSLKVDVVHAQHGYIPLLKGSKEIFENIGFILNDGERRVYHTSDSICFPNNYKCDTLLVPVSNHGVVMGPFEAALFAKETGASLVIPMHMDNPKFPVEKEKVREEFEKEGLNYKILSPKESVEA